jgi:glyoxylase-like metal-dependent hydrolase (beta-lactamase superfamily II)
MTKSLPSAPGTSAQELAGVLEKGKPIQILDVRAPERVAQGRIDLIPDEDYHNIRGSVVMTLGSLDETGLSPDRPVVVVCGRGKDSSFVAAHLNGLGADASSLTGGLAAWMNLLVPRKLDAPEGLDALLQFDRVGLGSLGYLLVSEGEAIIVDLPLRYAPYLEAVKNTGAEVVGIADTHAHADYVSGGPTLARELEVPYYLHPADAIYPYDGRPGAIDFHALSDGDQIPFGRTALVVAHTPGHTEGSVTFLCEHRVALTGDFLFVESIGRPDLGGKEAEWAVQLWNSVERVRGEWDDGLAIYPAHYAADRERRMGQAVGIPFGELLATNEYVSMPEEETFLRRILENTAPFPETYKKIKALNLGLAPIVQADVEEMEVGRNECALGGV